MIRTRDGYLPGYTASEDGDPLSEDITAKPWWDVARPPGYDSHFHHGWATIGLVLQSLRGGAPILGKHLTGSLKEGAKPEEVLKVFEEKFPTFKAIEKQDEEWCYFADHGTIKFEFDGDAKFSANFITRNAQFSEEFQAWYKENTTKTMPKGRVHVLISTKNGPDFKSMGIGGEALIRENYSDEVLRGYDRIVKDLGSENPAGRVAILDGKPGTGKTYLIRGILDEVKDVIMVIVPANLVVQLAQPGMIPALVDLHKSRGGRPMVFIIEDADEVLAPRQGDNMSAVSVMLNLGDGILGKLLDVRIVATTNAHRQELDEAIMRPGRLSASVAVGPLPYEKAKVIFERLAPGKELKEKAYTLAEIYSKARDEGWEPPKLDKRKMGFGAGDDDEDDDYDPYE